MLSLSFFFFFSKIITIFLRRFISLNFSLMLTSQTFLFSFSLSNNIATYDNCCFKNCEIVQIFNIVLLKYFLLKNILSLVICFYINTEYKIQIISYLFRILISCKNHFTINNNIQNGFGHKKFF